MEKLPSDEDRTKFFQNSANLAKTLAFWVTSASFVIGYLIVWKYLANNGELWLFPKVVSDYPFQLFMFGFVMVFTSFLLPFLFGIISELLTNDLTSQETEKNYEFILYLLYLVVNSWFVYVFVLYTSEYYRSYISAIVFYIIVFIILLIFKKINNILSFNVLLLIFTRTFFSLLSWLTFLLTLGSSKVFDLELSGGKIFLIILLIPIVLFVTFLGVSYVRLIKKPKDQLKLSIIKLSSFSDIRIKYSINGESAIFNFIYEKFKIEDYLLNGNIKIVEVIVLFSILFIIILPIMSSFFDIPRIIISGTGMGGRSYTFTLDKKKHFPHNINNGKYCIFIQTKGAFYITNQATKGKTFCDLHSSDVSVGPLVRLPKDDVISVTP